MLSAAICWQYITEACFTSVTEDFASPQPQRAPRWAVCIPTKQNAFTRVSTDEIEDVYRSSRRPGVGEVLSQLDQATTDPAT